ncbi:MAG: hypothetical protein ACK5H2_05695 [Beutenbergiaceae bacterium]
MRAPSADPHWSYRGLHAVVLDNGLTTAVVLPELGGKIWELRDGRSGRQFLWHNPRTAPYRPAFGSSYDDQFFGGWDVLFPNDIPEELAGEPYPDHGEVWASSWDWHIERHPDRVALAMELAAPISGARLRTTICLEAGHAGLILDQELANPTSSALPYLWKHHVALNVNEPARIDLPDARMELAEFGNPRAGGPGTRYRWPYLEDEDQQHDMRRTLPAHSGVCEFQYATDLAAGWCALGYDDGSGLGLAFDTNIFDSCWTFASYGGWRDHRVAVLEPCSGSPVSVSDGIAAGTHRTLQPGELLRTRLVATTFTGIRAVEEISASGIVTGAPL